MGLGRVVQASGKGKWQVSKSLADYVYHEWPGVGVLYCGDARAIVPDLSEMEIDSVVTDPIWPNMPAEMFPIDVSPGALLASVLMGLPKSVKRLAIQLGCNSDPRFLSNGTDRWPFFRTCWLEYVRPAYLGRLLYTSDIAYLFGEPPKSIDGNHVISGYCLLVNSTREKNLIHPCPRQPHHVQWIVRKFTNEDSVVLDPFAGSCTTALACIREQRQFVAIEINEDFAAEGAERIDREISQPRLPFIEPIKEVQAEMFSEGATT